MSLFDKPHGQGNCLLELFRERVIEARNRMLDRGASPSALIIHPSIFVSIAPRFFCDKCRYFEMSTLNAELPLKIIGIEIFTDKEIPRSMAIMLDYNTKNVVGVVDL